jgi:hypothetical protein
MMNATTNARMDLRAAATTLAEGRALRLQGAIDAVLWHERIGANLLTTSHPMAADDLLAAWEGSLESNPLDLEEWACHLKPSLPSHSQGIGPLLYLTPDGEGLCAACATAERHLLESEEGQVRWEGPVYSCDRCGAELESVYGDNGPRE